MVRVFLPEADGKPLWPPGAYGQAAEATRTFLRSLAENANELDRIEILNAPERLRTYYRQFYTLTGAAAMPRNLAKALAEGDFAEVAQRYRLIDAGTINILVPYEAQSFHALEDQIEKTTPLTPAFIRDWIDRARPYAVSPYRPTTRDAPIWSHVRPVQFSRRHPVGNEEAEWFIGLRGLKYSPVVGLEDPDGFLIS